MIKLFSGVSIKISIRKIEIDRHLHTFCVLSAYSTIKIEVEDIKDYILYLEKYFFFLYYMTDTRKKRSSNHKTRKQRGKQKERVYSKKDYHSGDGMMVSVWGPSMWHYLHIMSFNYPVSPTLENKKQYRDFILSLQHVLPCNYCRMNLKNNFKHLPLTMSDMQNRDTFSKYIYDLHELINKMLNKKSNLSYNDVRERYEHFRSRCTQEKPQLFTFEKVDSKKEKGCTEPLYGKKSKCIIKIVPQEYKGSTFQMDKKCFKQRL